MPHCFSERAVIEILFEELEEELDALHVRRHAEDERLELFDLPVGRNLRKSQEAFEKFFARYFEQRDSTRIEQLFSKALRDKRYEYAAIIFRLYERDWKESHPAYLQWIIVHVAGSANYSTFHLDSGEKVMASKT